MQPIKYADTERAIQPLLSRRWSPYVFDARGVAPGDLAALFEAARWAPSSYNEQPWRYLVARREEAPAFAKLLSCLVEANQVWARHAGALALGVAMRSFSRNGKPNRAAEHDLGLASGNLCAEATARGLSVHQMIGILPERARELYAIPAEAEPLTALAIGHAGENPALSEAMQQRDREPRARKRLPDFVFSGSWAAPADFSR